MEYITNDGIKHEFITKFESSTPSVFKHFKNTEYEILCLAYDSDSLKSMVVYQGLYGNHEIWVRDADMFFSLVDKNKYPDVKQQYRFEKIK